MKKILRCFGVSVVLGMLMFSNAYAEPKEISMEVIVLEIPTTTKVPTTSWSEETLSSKPGDAKVFSCYKEIVLTKDLEIIDAARLVKDLEALTMQREVTLVAKEKITALEGAKATIDKMKDVLYLEEIDKDTFKLKKLTGKEGAGTFFEAIPTITKDGRINVECELTIRKVMGWSSMGRMPIEGAEGLNVGYPLLSDRSTSSNVDLNEGQPMVLGGLLGKGQCFLIILTVKVNNP